uniref:Phosphoinositide-binding clathrin adaptor, N-terminal n=3 Tax=Solanum tuberosum TaxID=4113 RepID=M1CJU9_SOLTU
MASGVFCGVVPFIFRRKPSLLKEEDTRKTRRLHTRVIKKLPSMLVPRRSKTNKGSKSRNACGVKAPKSPRLQSSNVVKAPKSPRMHSSNGVKAITRSPTFQNSCGVASNFRIMTGIRNKIITLRHLLDLSPCDGSESANELLISTLRDLHKLFPSINPNFSLSKIDGTSIHEKVRCFCDILKSIGEMWTGNDEWMITCKENSHSKLNDFEYVLALLDDIIKLASERMSEMTNEDEHEHEDEVEHEHEDETEDEGDQTRETSTSPDTFEKNFSEIYSSNNSSLSSSPTSVLPEIITNSSKKNGKASITSPLLLSLKVQAVGNQNPIEVRRLSFHMIPNANQDSGYSVQLGSDVDEKGSNTEANQDCELMDLPEILLNSLEKASENGGIFWTGASNGQAVPARVTFDVLLPPYSISRLQSNVTEQSSVPPSPNILSPKIIESQVPTSPQPEPQPDSSCENEEPEPASPPAHITSGNTVTPPPPPPPSPITSKNRAVPCPPPPPPRKSENVHSPPPPPPPPCSPHKGLKGMVTPHPLPPKASNRATPPTPPPTPMGKVAAPPPPPMPMGKRVANPPSPRSAPPPPMQTKKGGAPPPPPPTFAGAKNPRLKKAATKLKRSSQMGNLYRSLKGKVEGSSLDGKQKGGKGKFNASKGGKPGMADALAEMTKRSAYFQQIEEDVKNHAKLIKEMKKAIASFNTSDMSELITFHNYVESHLEKLTDESQVLARFEDFPCKKLEALRTAATLYSKLDSIVSTLQNWQPASPVGQHLARAERYFNKIKGDVDTLERTKDEESKKLKTHKIQFDFGALVRIKELMVDVSSNCMELALKEKREAMAGGKEGAGPTNEGIKKESATQLWKAFQFAFRVYTFAGGQDERAEKLTKELAEVIETDLHH